MIPWAEIETHTATLASRWTGVELTGVHGVPAGGAPVACLVSRHLDLPVLDGPVPGCLVVDDLVDSGRTAARYPGHAFDALYRKPHSPTGVAPDAHLVDEWLTFPWEPAGTGPEDAVVRLLEWMGEDPTRTGLSGTPGRVVRSLKEMTAGYADDAAQHLAVTFPETSDQMVVLHGIEFVSMCEHHLLPFTGRATVGYIPGAEVVGLSKLARTVDVFARRLQIQERLTGQIADAIDQSLTPVGVGVIVEAHHSCMSLRGVGKRDATMTTSALRGVMKTNTAARQEFLGFRHG